MEKEDKIKILIGIVAILTCLLASVCYIVLVTEPELETHQYVDLAEIENKSEGFVSVINLLINQTRDALVNYYTTNNVSNVTYIAQAENCIQLARNTHQDYLSWYLHESKEIDDGITDWKIINGICQLENQICVYTVDVYIAYYKSTYI